MMPPDPSWWAHSPDEQLSAIVAPHRLTALVTLDGTRRWAYLHHPETRTSWSDYASRVAIATMALVDRCFRLGIQTVLIPLLYPPNFQRDEGWLRLALGPLGLARVLDDEHLAAYGRWGARARLGGTWRAAQPWAAEAMGALDEALRAATPTGERLVIWECDAGNVVTAMLEAAQHHGPDPEAIRQRFYPEGPERVHLAILGGWIRTPHILPILMQEADFYITNRLTLDLTSGQLRAIVYDYLFQRRVAPEDNMSYSNELLADYDRWYQRQPPRLVGLGSLTPGGLWVVEGGLPVDEP